MHMDEKTVYFQVQLSTKIIITITIIMLESTLKIIYKRIIHHLKVRISVSDLKLVFCINILYVSMNANLRFMFSGTDVSQPLINLLK